MKIGLDVGGTKIEGIVLDDALREVRRLRIETGVSHGYNHVVERIAVLYQALRKSIGDRPHALGIGTPGSISVRTGLLKNCNATALNGHPLRKDLEAVLNRPFSLHNDANCFAYAEAMRGAGRRYKVVLGVVLGTGCGAGIVINGALHVGRHAIAGEWGHHVFDPTGPECYCGRRGCLERHVSGSALAAAYEARKGHASSAQDIAFLADKGDEHARAVMDAFIEMTSQGIANVIAVLDPDVIVIGGGLSNMPRLYEDLPARLRELIFNDSFEIEILRNELGDSAGVFGAAYLGISE